MRDGILLAEDPPASLIQSHYLTVSAPSNHLLSIYCCYHYHPADIGRGISEALPKTRRREGDGIWRRNNHCKSLGNFALFFFLLLFYC